jgi:hypothetical protein
MRVVADTTNKIGYCRERKKIDELVQAAGKDGHGVATSQLVSMAMTKPSLAPTTVGLLAAFFWSSDVRPTIDRPGCCP